MPLELNPVELELHIRSLIAAELRDAVDWPDEVRPKVEMRPRYIASESDLLTVTAITNPQGKKETRFVLLELAGFTETDEGACDHTLLTLSYSIEVLFGFVDKRPDGSNSHDDFVAYLMSARERFKNNRTFGYARSVLEHKLLQTIEAAQVKEENSGTAHRILLGLNVEIG